MENLYLIHGGDELRSTRSPPLVVSSPRRSTDTMGSLSHHCELVVLLFSPEPLDSASWQDVFRNVATLVMATFKDTPEDPDSPRLRVLDGSSSMPRVVELVFTLNREITLQDCRVLATSPQIQDLEDRSNVAFVLQPGELYAVHRQPGLAVFDMDSTLIQQEAIDELARAVGLHSQVAAITEAAMRGEAPYMDFEASLRARVALLKGVPDTIWEQLQKDVISFTPGARDMICVLKHLGWKTAVLSGGFTPLANWVQQALGLDYAYANHLVENTTDKTLTGELMPGTPIIHGKKKQELLVELAEKNSVPVERIIAVGDGSNDLPMMEAAGLGIAFNAKPKVQAAAPSGLNSSSLVDVLHILGYTRQEIDESLALAA